LNHRIRVLIAEDSEPMRRYYAYVFKDAAGFELLPTASNGYEAIAMAALYKPDVAILDVEMESRDAGLRAGESILSILPGVKIIIMTVYDDDATIFRAYEMGAVDYIIKNADAQIIMTAVKDAYEGKSAIRPDISERMRKEFRRLKHSENMILQDIRMVYQLSVSERSILCLLLEGKLHKEICEIRCIELSTLKTHIRNMLAKFGAKDTHALVEMVNKMDISTFLRTCDETEDGKSIKDSAQPKSEV